MQHPISTTNLNKTTNPVFLFKEEEKMYDTVVKMFEGTPNDQNPNLNPKTSTGYVAYSKHNLNDNEILQDAVQFIKDQNNVTEDLKHYAYSFGYYRYFYVHNKKQTVTKSKYERNRYIYYEEQIAKPDDKVSKKINKYNDKFGLKLQNISMQDLNKQLQGAEDLQNQFWEDKPNLDEFNEHKDKINHVLQLSKNGAYEQRDRPNANNKVCVSSLLSKITNAKPTEEIQNNLIDQNVHLASNIQGTLSTVRTFINNKTCNQLDDLQELLKDSKKYNEARNISANNPYTDKHFQPHGDNIFGFGDRNDYSSDECHAFEWKRTNDIFKGDLHIFNNIEPNDIHQGGLGDCYFLASISAIAEYKDRITRLFLTKEINKEGIYAVALCVGGMWHDIVIDDWIPCNPGTNTPAFNTTKTNELWVILLEKAWAKIYGGYLNIAAGLTREALRDLTGASCVTLFTNGDKEELWAKIFDADHKKYIMTAGSDDLNNGSDTFIEKIGIAGSHAYSLLGAFELEYDRGNYKLVIDPAKVKNKTIERIVKLRNPWGTGEWSGDWGDLSPLWTDALKKDLCFTVEDDGTFFMSYKDFCKFYSDVQICYYVDGNKYSSIYKESTKDETTYLKFTINVDGEYYFSINQKNKRMFPKNHNYKYSNISFVIARVDVTNNQYEYIGGNMKADKENWIKKTAKKGSYIAIVKTPWQSFVNDFSFSVYGPGTTDILSIKENELPKSLINHIFYSHAETDKKQVLMNFASQGHSDIKYKSYDNKGGFGYIYFANESTETSLSVTVEFIGSYNIKLLHPLSGLRPSLTVDPGKTKIIVYEASNMPYSMQMRMLSMFKPKEIDAKLKELIKTSEHVIAKQYNGQDVDIKMQILYHNDGADVLYTNNTDKMVLSESIEYKLKNCHIEGVYGGYMDVVIKPRKELLIEIIKDEGVDSFEITVDKIWYKIG